VYGDHKVGKSTFGASCPKPVFIQTEDGLESLGVDAFPLCRTFGDVMKQMDHLITQPHEFKTLVLDSLDWCEKLIWADICQKNNWSQLGEGSYGAGYKLAVNYWRELLEKFDVLNRQRKMIIVLLAHAKVSKFEDPERENYDKWDLDLHDRAGKLLLEYVDVIGYACLKTAVITKKSGFGETTKAKTTGERQLCLNAKAAYEAGNRYDLPDTLPLAWEPLASAIKATLAARKAPPVPTPTAPAANNLEAIAKARESMKTKLADPEMVAALPIKEVAA
jgi:hypothetical protein